jgi:hypothetical protein
MPKPDYRYCRTCGRDAHEVGALSHTRQCVECGQVKLEQNALGMHVKSGEAWLRWRRAMAASVGGVLLDEVPPRP